MDRWWIPNVGPTVWIDPTNTSKRLPPTFSRHSKFKPPVGSTVRKGVWKQTKARLQPRACKRFERWGKTSASQHSIPIPLSLSLLPSLGLQGGSLLESITTHMWAVWQQNCSRFPRFLWIIFTYVRKQPAVSYNEPPVEVGDLKNYYGWF